MDNKDHGLFSLRTLFQWSRTKEPERHAPIVGARHVRAPWQQNLPPLTFQDEANHTFMPQASGITPAPDRGDALARVPATGDDTVVPGAVEAEARTIGPRLMLVGLALPRLDRLVPAARAWQIGITVDGRLAEEGEVPVLRLSATLGDRWVRCRPTSEAGMPRGVRLDRAGHGLDEHFMALLNLAAGPILAIPDIGAANFGRTMPGQRDQDDVLSFPVIGKHALVLGAGEVMPLDMILSRVHLSLWLRQGQLNLTMAQGKTPVWRLDREMRPVDSLSPLGKRQLTLSIGEFFIAGSLIVKFSHD